MSKIESSLDKLLIKLGQLKGAVKARLCALWQKYSPQLDRYIHQIKQIDYATAKAFVIRFKWRILLVLIVLYAGSKAYDYFFPASEKAGGPVTVTSVVVEKKDIPLIIESTGTIVSSSIVDIRPMVTNTVAKIEVKDEIGRAHV